MDVGIVNSHELIPTFEIAPDLRKACEDLVFNKVPSATDTMLDFTQREKAAIELRKRGGSLAPAVKEKSWRDLDAIKRLEHALVNGISEFVNTDVEEARQSVAKPLHVSPSTPLNPPPPLPSYLL